MKTFMIVVLLCFILALVASATPQFSSVFNQTYKPKSGTALSKAGCTICHVKAGPPALNPYGKALDNKPATAASLKSIEKLDSDKDCSNNITEIKAGTLPGDAKSKPAASAQKSATRQPAKKIVKVPVKTTSKTMPAVKPAAIKDVYTDPACKMTVDKSSTITSTYKGVRYHFCSKECKAKFDKNPAQFVKK